ncbi:MAG: methanethiol S-methyltransferase [Gemmatimonadota bacterium]
MGTILQGGHVKRALILLYGTVAYFAFFGTFVYFIGFVGNLTPVAIDSPRQSPLAAAFFVNLALVVLFAAQHTIMARKPFKRWISRHIPYAVERSTFVLAATLLLALMMWQWQPLGGTVWEVTTPALRALLYGFYAFGWVLLFAASFAINHFDLFGLRQAWLGFRRMPYTPIQFRNPWLYRQVRHPLYLGFFLGLWATPTMTVTHMVLAAGLTAYTFFGVGLEERDLVVDHPEYEVYRETVPMFVPGLRRAAAVPDKGLSQADA